VFNFINLSLFSVGVLFLLCVASPRKNLSLGPSFGGCGFSYVILSLIVLGAYEKTLKERLRAQTIRTKISVVAIILIISMISVSPYLNPISQRNRGV